MKALTISHYRTLVRAKEHPPMMPFEMVVKVVEVERLRLPVKMGAGTIELMSTTQTCNRLRDLVMPQRVIVRHWVSWKPKPAERRRLYIVDALPI